jgi:D-glycero-alpha-D-manno-heptose-7-phosphate kinase
VLAREAARRDLTGSAAQSKDIVRCQAPLRISFCGGGTDVPPYPELYGGCVLSCTIDKYAYVSMRSREIESVRVESRDLKRVMEFTSHEDDTQPDLAMSIIRRFGETSLDCYMHSDAPPGSGLGSSSAMIVSLIGALAKRQGLHLTAYKIAELALVVEREDLQIAGGMQDQYAAAFGGFNFIEFAKDQVIVNQLRVPQETLDELHYNLLLCYTGKTRFSSNILQEQTDNVRVKDSVVLASLGHVKDLTLEMKKALLTGNCRAFGDLLNQAWQLKRTFASAISNTQIDEMYWEALKAGALGGKLLGAGGGGYLLLFVPFMRRDSVQQVLEQMGGSVTDFQFDSRGVRTWIAPPELWFGD